MNIKKNGLPIQYIMIRFILIDQLVFFSTCSHPKCSLLHSVNSFFWSNLCESHVKTILMGWIKVWMHSMRDYVVFTELQCHIFATPCFLLCDTNGWWKTHIFYHPAVPIKYLYLPKYHIYSGVQDYINPRPSWPKHLVLPNLVIIIKRTLING
jgi:hypothetical protein